jgi:diguanylate cyclase (GGDEF)-like protein
LQKTYAPRLGRPCSVWYICVAVKHLAAVRRPIERAKLGGTRAGSRLAPTLCEFARGLARPRRRAEVLAALMRATSTTRLPDRMAGQILDLAVDWFGGEAWAILAVNEGRDLQWLAGRGVPRARRAMMIAAAERAVHHGEIAWSSQAVRRPDPVRLVAIPVKSHGRPVAVMVGVEDGAGISAADRLPEGAALAPMAELTDGIAGALDTAMRLGRANALSTTDDLTGLYNFRFLSGALRREVKRSVRTGRPLSLLFVDLDGFKGINDRYGHLYGSRALVEAAGRIASAARETDVVARFGGDEFALVLPDTGREGAMLVGRRVRERVAGTPFLAGAGIDYPLTASVGAATLSAGSGTPEAMLAAADGAMYRVKGRGKNGFEMADLVPSSSQP